MTNSPTPPAQSNRATDTGEATTNPPTISSIQDLIPSFPLTDAERIYTADGMTGAEVTIPITVRPAGSESRADTIGYYVQYAVHEVLGTDDHDRYVISPEKHRTGKEGISAFERRIAQGTVIQKREDFTVAASSDTTPGSTTTATLHFDGASRGNPGDAATGYVLTVSGEKDTGGRCLEDHTNNEAEYKSLIDGLEAAHDAGVTDITVKGDSQLIIRQVTGEYACNATNLSPLHDTVQELLAQFDAYDIEHVPRDENSPADTVANEVLDGVHD